MYRKYKIWKMLDCELSKGDLEKCQLLDSFINDLLSLEKKVSDDYPNSIFYMKGDTVWLQQISKYKYIYCRYETIWSFFKTNFGYNNQEIKEIMNAILENHLKLEGYTPIERGRSLLR